MSGKVAAAAGFRDTPAGDSIWRRGLLGARSKRRQLGRHGERTNPDSEPLG